MVFLTKVNGQLSQTNIFNLMVFGLGVVEIFRPLIPQEYIPYIVAGIAVVNLYLRTFQTGGEQIQKSFEESNG